VGVTDAWKYWLDGTSPAQRFAPMTWPLYYAQVPTPAELASDDPPVIARRVAPVLVLTFVYVVVASFGLSLASVAEQVTVVWPPTGLAIAALFLLGPRLWPGITLGALVANLLVHAPPMVAASIAAGNTLEALLAAWMLRRVGFDPTLSRLRDAVAFIVLAACV